MVPGQAVFQDAGLPHAYLEGQNIEIMANSDNVLRGGLTSKHVDVPELMKHIKFGPTIPNIITAKTAGSERAIFATTAADFELGCLHIAKGKSVDLLSHSLELFLVFSGSVEATEKKSTGFKRNKGEAWVSFDGAHTTVKALEDAVIYQAAVPGLSD